MAYTISRYNGTLITTVQDGTIDTSLDIKLVGKSYAGYGQAQNENFVYLLENFANPTSPPNPLTGQVWYDTSVNKLKFYDGSKYRSAGGAEVGESAPVGLTTGDFWFDTKHGQLFTWSGTTFTLIGPQATSTNNTQMQTITLRDNAGGSHVVIQAVDNGSVVFVINSDTTFTLDNTANAITGFTDIHQGITLANTNNQSQPGVTTTSHRFWGTASNAEQLGGFDASNYVKAGTASFNQSVTFSDNGYTVGNPISKLRVFNDGATVPTILSQITSQPIVFKTTNASSQTVTVMQLGGTNMTDLLPGNDYLAAGAGFQNNIGSQTQRWNNIFAGYVYSTAEKSDSLTVTTTATKDNIATTNNVTGYKTVVARDNTGTINVTYMNGTAQQSDKLYYSTLGSYVATSDTSTPSSIVVRDASANITVNNTSLFSITKTGASSSGDIGQSNNRFNAIYAVTHNGNLVGNVTGNTAGTHTGNVIASDNTTTLIDAATKTFNGTVNTSTGRALLGDGTLSNPSLAFNSDVNKDTGFYWGGEGLIKVTNNSTLSATFSATGLTIPGVTNTGSIITSTITTSTLTTGGAGTAGTVIGTWSIGAGSSLQATYADLAEKYLPDAEYDVGTVLMIGGEKEVTACQAGFRAYGPVTENPAYKMNSDLEGGVYVALKGRVPVKVIGNIIKGQRLVAGQDGTAQAAVGNNADAFAIALASSNEAGVKLIECVLI